MPEQDEACKSNCPKIALAIGSGEVDNTGLGPEVDPFAKTADNFCAQALYLVHVTFATLRRFCSVAPFL